MFILGLQGSPRKGGNTDTFLSAFMEKAGQAGAATKIIPTANAGVVPCIGCGHCEKYGVCAIADDTMATTIYGLLRQADLVVAATPVYFYGMSAQLKILVDRCQTLWSRKYVCKLEDPLASSRKGLLFSVAASHGRQVFDGVHLTGRYFFDAIDAQLEQSITYRGIETKGAIRQHREWLADIEAAVEKTVVPLARRLKILFVSPQGTCLAPMAAAEAQRRFGDRIRTDFAGRLPAADLSEAMLRCLQRKGIDLRYRRPQTVEETFVGMGPDRLIVIGDAKVPISAPALPSMSWPIAPPSATDDASVERAWEAIGAHLDRLKQWID